MWRGARGRDPGRTGGGRGQEGGEQGGGSGIYVRVGSGSKNEGDSLLFITGYYSVNNTYLEKFSNFHLTSTNA